jgi:hypothetical protein
MRDHWYWLAMLALLGASGAPAEANAGFTHGVTERIGAGVVTIASTPATATLSERMAATTAPVHHAPILRRVPPPHTVVASKPVIQTPRHTTSATVEHTGHAPAVAADHHRTGTP